MSFTVKKSTDHVRIFKCYSSFTLSAFRASGVVLRGGGVLEEGETGGVRGRRDGGCYRV